jgi:hypothetical protein
MVSQTNRTVAGSTMSREAAIQRRHSIAAVVYFLYGLFYLWGAQYITNMQMTSRGMPNSRAFFMVGAVLTVLLPWLIYSRFALALSLHWQPRAQRTTLFINFTLLLGIMVMARVYFLLRGEIYARSWLHATALAIAMVNAACLLWASLRQPLWITRAAQGTE